MVADAACEGEGESGERERETERAHSSQSPEEAVGDWDIHIVPQDLQHFSLHGQYLLPVVGVITQVQEVIHKGWTQLLQTFLCK